MEQRVIKFRVWHKKHRQMEYEGHNEFKGGGSSFISKATMFNYGSDAIIMQFTGLPEKTKQEVYENDIIIVRTTNDWTQYMGQIKWDDDEGCYVIETTDHHAPILCIIRNVIELDSIEKLGNIFENPELITK